MPKTLSATHASIAQATWNWNWEADKQTTIRTVAEYLELGRGLRGAMLDHIEGIMSIVPGVSLKDESGKEYKLADLPKLREELTTNPDDTRFMKTQMSATRKLTDVSINQQPERIRDYLRFQIICDDVQDVQATRAVIQSGKMGMTSQKDRFRHPCPEGGHRAYLYHAVVGEGAKTLKFEGMICLRAIEEFGVDKTLRSAERDFNKVATGRDTKPTRAPAFAEASEKLRQLRKATMYDLCSTIEGLDAMLSPKVVPSVEFATAITAFNDQSPGSRAHVERVRPVHSERVTGLLNRAFH